MIVATHPVSSGDRAIRRRDMAVPTAEAGRRHDGRSWMPGGHTPGKSLVEHVEKDLARNFGEQLTLRDIERSSGYSVYQIIRAFRRRLGITPHAYLVRMRLRYAAELLLQGESIAGVAAEAGFSDQSHLTRHFKRAFGITPKQYLLDRHQDGPAGRPAASLLSQSIRGTGTVMGRFPVAPVNRGVMKIIRREASAFRSQGAVVECPTLGTKPPRRKSLGSH